MSKKLEMQRARDEAVADASGAVRNMRHSTVWNQITAIACKQAGCHYRSVKVADSRFDPREKSKARPGFAALNAGQEAMVNDPDTVKVMGREFYRAVPLPSEVKNTNEPFDHARWGDGEINAAYTEL